MPIPLPALGIQAPPQTDILGQAAKLRQFQAMGQEQQLRGQQIQAGQLENQMRQRELQDQQTVMQVLGQHQGDLDSALPELASKVSAKTFMGLDKYNRDRKKESLDLDAKTRDAKIAVNGQKLGLIEQAQQLAAKDPQAYAQAYPQIAQQMIDLDPSYKKSIDPNNPVPPEMLDRFKLGLMTDSTYEAKAKSQREIAAQQETVRHNQATEKQQQAGLENNVSEPKLALRASQGDPDAAKALKLLQQQKIAARPVNNIMTGNDAKDIADAIENGDQPPSLQGLYRNAGPVRAELARRKVPLAQMEMDWNATKKYVSTLNGAQQVRLRQAISSASDMADKIDDLYKQYHDVVGDAGMKAFNKAGLVAAQNLPGKAGALAHALVAQISDLTADLGNVYMGGNSPTDHALGLAGKNLSADWNRETFEEGIKQVHANIKIRQNSITHAMPAGVSGDSTYFKAPADAPAAPAAQSPSGGGFSVKAPNNKTYSFKDQQSLDNFKKAASIQ